MSLGYLDLFCYSIIGCYVSINNIDAKTADTCDPSLAPHASSLTRQNYPGAFPRQPDTHHATLEQAESVATFSTER
jgi:hypothetical protein